MTDPTTQPRVLAIPELSLVALVGASGSGKSTFARRHFGRYEVISSDVCRGMVSVDENDQSVTADAFELLGHIAGKRLAAGHLTVVDATNVQRDARRHVLDLAKANDVLPVAIVLDLREEICATRDAERPDRTFGRDVIRRQRDQLRRSFRGLAKEGFRQVHVLTTVEDIEAVSISSRTSGPSRSGRVPPRKDSSWPRVNRTRGTLRTCSDPLHSGAQANRPACASSCASSQRFASRPPP